HAASAWARLTPLIEGSARERGQSLYLLPYLAWANWDMREQALAEAQVSEAIGRAQASDLRIALVDALRIRALLHLQQQRWDEAQAALEEAVTLSRAMPYPYAEAKALYVYGLLHQARGEQEQARKRWQAALEILGLLGERLYAEPLERTLAAVN